MADKPGLKIVGISPEPLDRSAFLEACIAQVNQLVILGATTMVFLSDIEDKLEVRSVPRSASLEMGAIANATMQYPLLGGWGSDGE